MNSLLSLKNKHKGHRCFIIGNGPSLKAEDLDKIKGEIAFASNKIFLIFKETSWRPTYYTAADMLFAEQYGKDITKISCLKILPKDQEQFYTKLANKKSLNSYLFFKRIKSSKGEDGQYLPIFKEDIEEGIHTGYTITNVNIQLAYYMGFSEIILLGVDGNYIPASKTTNHHYYGKVYISGGEPNHFHPDYIKKGEMFCIPNISNQEKGYLHFRIMLESHNRQILNASRNTKVKAFQIVSLEDCLKGKKLD